MLTSHRKMDRVSARCSAIHHRLLRLSFCCLFTSLLLVLIPSGFSEMKPDQVAHSGPLQPVFPDKGAYTGAYIDFGPTEDAVTLDAIEDFEAMVGKRQAIVASSSYWGEQSFPMKNLQIVSRHGALPLVYWSPWDRPYVEKQGTGRFSIENILAGKCDSYIDRWGEQAKEFGKPFLVSWGLEMNGDWFPWSGCFCGGGRKVPHSEPVRYEGPETYKKAFRYVVDRVRAKGAANILWGFHANNISFPKHHWNLMEQYYPGPAYVDWLGLSVYGKQFRDGEWWVSFHEVMNSAYQELCRLDAAKPVIIAEWGVGEYPQAGSKAEWIQEALQNMITIHPRVKGAVFWHERWQNEDGSYSNLRVNSSPEALDAFRRGIAHPRWLDRPLYGARQTQ